jgi:hypothetical protein
MNGMQNGFEQMRPLINIGLLVLISCGAPNEKEDLNYIESKLSFYDPFNDKFTFDTWIRNPENIREVHETLKKYGYVKLFSNSDLNSDYCSYTGFDIMVEKPCKNIIDSLLITYPDLASAPKYYKEFWLRRRNERNDTTVYEVLKEIKAELFENQRQRINENIVNDTILNLVRIKTESPKSDTQALENFEYLKKIGLHSSAYNLLYERYSYYEINWDSDDLKKSLKKATTKCCPWPIIEDDTK